MDWMVEVLYGQELDKQLLHLDLEVLKVMVLQVVMLQVVRVMQELLVVEELRMVSLVEEVEVDIIVVM